MNTGQITDQNGRILFSKIHSTTSAWERMRGLLGSSELNAQQGLLIEPCNMVHTAFMNQPIDLIFLDKFGNITALRENVKPWRMAVNLPAKKVLETRAGMIQQHKLTVASRLTWEGIGNIKQNGHQAVSI